MMKKKQLKMKLKTLKNGYKKNASGEKEDFEKK